MKCIILAATAVCLCSSLLPAQTANPLSTELKQMYTGVKNNLTRSAEKMPEDDYSFKATADIRSFGQLIAHVADSQARTCSTLAGEPKQLGAASKTSKAELVAALKESFAMCDAVVDGLTDAKAAEMVKLGRGERSRLGALAGMVSHSNEEYGYLCVYMRLKGVVPASSEPRK
ncbi:DinB family protein [uncultured Paludibaculum sp.]|uniref:DinB family protein n=1 Tax=uncultured Paludibaculum sp. TaxID=1765020 RepID=UPI002AAB95D2|nr:DinB family protein [uncultured Paludibaculum sp.]